MPFYSQTSDNNLHAQAAVRRHSLTPTPFGGLYEEAFRRFPAFEIQAIQTEERQTRLYACRWRIRLLLSTAKRVPRFFCHPFRPLKTAPECKRPIAEAVPPRCVPCGRFLACYRTQGVPLLLLVRNLFPFSCLIRIESFIVFLS